MPVTEQQNPDASLGEEAGGQVVSSTAERNQNLRRKMTKKATNLITKTMKATVRMKLLTMTPKVSR